MEKRAELVFIPSPLVGHLVSTVEIAKLLLHRHRRLSLTFLLIRFPAFSDSKTPSYLDSLTSSIPSSFAHRIRFLHLPPPAPPAGESPPSVTPVTMSAFMQSYKPAIRDAVAQLRLTGSEVESDSARPAGFVVDMFCTAMIDVADEFGVPSYLFFTSGACALGLSLHVQALHDELGVDPAEFKDSDAELSIPCFANPVPAAGVFPTHALEKENGGSTAFVDRARSFRRTKGILVNTFEELESHVLESLTRDGGTKIPTVYPVGPILNPGNEPSDKAGSAEMMTWLDAQPPLSVVFLCFGSMGSFGAKQVKEIARGVEKSGQGFLWSVRKPPPKDTRGLPGEYAAAELGEVLPEGFLERTAEKGRIVGWVPQVEILSHAAVGGFVSHCGWNSILESVWCGVPIATWPMYAEQQLNAFVMVRELGMSVEIALEYRKETGSSEGSRVVGAEEIERGIRGVMERESGIRERVKEMKEKSRKAVREGGSSYLQIGRFVEDAVNNIP